MTPDTILPYLKLSQYDAGREISFVMKDGSEEYTVPSGATVKLEGTKPSGFGFTITCTVDGSTATAVTTEGMTDEWGTVVAELVVRQGNNRIGSSNVRFDIERSPHPEGTTDGSAEQIIPALTLLLRQIEEDLDDAEADIETMTQLKTATETAAGNEAGAEAAQARATEIVAGCITIDAETSELIIYE